MPERTTAGGAVLCRGTLEETTGNPIHESADPGLRFVVFFAIPQGDAGTVDRLASTVLAAQRTNAFAQIPRGKGKTIHRLPGGMCLFGGEVLLRNHELGDGDKRRVPFHRTIFDGSRLLVSEELNLEVEDHRSALEAFGQVEAKIVFAFVDRSVGAAVGHEAKGDGIAADGISRTAEIGLFRQALHGAGALLDDGAEHAHSLDKADPGD